MKENKDDDSDIFAGVYRGSNKKKEKNDHLSEFFPENFGLLYNGMKESYETQICFPTFNSSEMKIILEYAYTGSVREETLTDNNIID
ncbi:hypothetical protein RhiirA1_475871 [Rhizophagus irregularis]|uniref:BTB domain-containing protein n=1 Tax=Rhizophagus irregularis TaxID=588596 RepID=A0A2N0QW76_9GLOM|nr:hypothetical protein RhiirA1_475871 [Rhizophagus irregularis]